MDCKTLPVPHVDIGAADSGPTGKMAASNSAEETYKRLAETAEWLKARMPAIPEIGIVCGSGLGGLADSMDAAKDSFDYKDIPNFPHSTG